MNWTFDHFQVNSIKALVERQMRSQNDIQEALRAHTSVITREVCDMLKRFVNARLQAFSEGLDKRFQAKEVSDCSSRGGPLSWDTPSAEEYAT